MTKEGYFTKKEKDLIEEYNKLAMIVKQLDMSFYLVPIRRVYLTKDNTCDGGCFNPNCGYRNINILSLRDGSG